MTFLRQTFSYGVTSPQTTIDENRLSWFQFHPLFSSSFSHWAFHLLLETKVLELLESWWGLRIVMEYFSADSPCLKHKSPFCKRFPRQRDPFNLEKLPFEDVLNRQKHFYPTSPLPPELLALGRICKNAKSRRKEIKRGKPCGNTADQKQRNTGCAWNGN